MKKYSILIGRFSASGSGSSSEIIGTNNKKQAIKEFNKLVYNEKKDIKSWNLKKGEYIEITIINNKIEYFDDSIIKSETIKG